MQLHKIELDLVLKVTTGSNPIVAEFTDRRHTLKSGEYSFPISITEIDQLHKIHFSGFTPEDRSQKIELYLMYNKKNLDTKKISTFDMNGNQYVDNKVLKSYDIIYFNGTLCLEFTNSWIEGEIIAGFSISKNKSDFISISQGIHNQQALFTEILKQHKTKKIHDIAMIGTCHQTDAHNKTTPSLFNKLLQEYPSKSLINYSSRGLNDWCIMHNSMWLLDNLKVKNLLFTLNVGSLMCFKIKFCDHVSYWPFLLTPDKKNFAYKQQLKLYRWNRRRFSLWEKILNAKLDLLLKRCKELDVNPIILNFGNKKIWHDKEIINWEGMYRDNKDISTDKRTQFTNQQVFEKIRRLIV